MLYCYTKYITLTVNKKMADIKEICYIEDSILKLDKLLQSDDNFPMENLSSLKMLLNSALKKLEQKQNTIVANNSTENDESLNIRNQLRKEIKDEFKDELKNKSSLNLCIEDDVIEFIKEYCDIEHGKSIQSSKLTQFYNDMTNSDLTVRRVGIIMKEICDKYPIKKQLKTAGTYYIGLGIKQEYLIHLNNIKYEI